MAHGAVITSPVAKGRILSIDTGQAMKQPGVILVLSHLNAPEVPGYKQNPGSAIPIFAGAEFKPFMDDQVKFAGQPVAMVIAETIWQAEFAATLVRVQYREEAHQTNMLEGLAAAVRPDKPTDHSRGDMGLMDKAPVLVREEYRTPLQVHNPMETHATTAYWEGEGKLYIYNKSQGVKTTRQQFAKYFQLKEEDVKVSSPYVGGAFGSSSRMWPQEMMAVLGALKAGRPVQVSLQRSQVFNMVGYRPYSIQRVAIGAQRDGTIVGISHEAYVNNNLADYHVPVHTDFPEVDIHFIDAPDPVIDPMGAKGLGEVGLIGLTAGIANAVYHATGRRIRELPITADKLI